MKKICKICGQEFETIKNGHTRKYCYNCVPSQTEGFSHAEIVTYKRNSMKKALVKYKGGACCKCGYNKCLRALEFHHLDPSKKDFTISNDHFKLKDADRNSIWIQHYPKASWIFAANIYSITNSIESSKIITLLFMYIGFCLILDFCYNCTRIHI